MGPEKKSDSAEIARSKKAIDKAHNEQQKLVLLREHARHLEQRHVELHSLCQKLQEHSAKLGKKTSANVGPRKSPRRAKGQ